MSGGLVLGAAGAAIGSMFGVQGIGWSIGSALGGFLDRPDSPGGQAQPLMDLKITGTEYGQPIPYIRGALRVAGQLWWNSDRIPIHHGGGGDDGGGKGGEPETPEQEQITYDVDLLIGLHDAQIIGITEVYHNKKLIYRVDAGASAGTIAASNLAEYWERMTVYTGADDQLPDPDYEAWVDANVGVGLAPAYRQRGTVFIKSLHLGQSGAIPNLEFTVVVDGATATTITYFVGLTSDTTQNTALFSIAHGETWVDDPSHGPPARIGIHNLSADTWTYIDLEEPSPVWSVSSDGPRMLMVPEWDTIFVNLAGSTVTARAFSLSDHTEKFNLTDVLESGNTFSVIGVDPANSTILITDAVSGLSMYTTDSDGRPLTQIVSYGTGAVPGANTKAWPDADGVYWFIEVGGNNIWRMDESGRTLISTGADSALDNGEQTVFDTTRQCLFFWSDIGGGVNEYLKKIDCATSVISRVSAGISMAGVTRGQGSLLYASDRDQIVSLKEESVFLMDPDDGALDATYPVPLQDFDMGYCSYSPGVIFTTAPDGYAEMILDALSVDCPTVANVQSGVCVRSGLTAGQINVAPLSTITREVCSFVWSQVTPGRTPSELLMTGFFYEAVMSGKQLKFVPRGGSPIATIPWDDLGATKDGQIIEAFAPRKSNDVELPAWTDVTYFNLASNYQQDTQPSDRLISATGVTRNPIDMALGMQPAEAKGVADTISLDQAASCLEATISVLRSDYPTLEPTDTFLVTDQDGSEYRMRAVAVVDSFPLLTIKAVLDDPTVLESQQITSVDYTSQTTVAAPVATALRPLDIPILRDADDDAGFYAAAKGTANPWPGASVYKSADDVTYARVAQFTDIAIMGSCTTALGNYSGPRVFDRTNTVRVNVGAGVTLSSSTRDAVLTDRSVNLFLIGDEIIQAIDADLISDGVYDLSRLLRGQFGTEWAQTGHAAGERCVLLRTHGLRRIVLDNSEIGVLRYYRAVTAGRTIGTATTQQFTSDAVGLTPYSPADVRVTRDASNNATVSIDRRTRFAPRLVPSVSIPLAESVESYSVDFYTDDTYTTIAATLAVSGADEFTYSAAEQTADGLDPTDPFWIDAHQVSSIVGRGYALRVER
jgi:putative tail protein